MRSQMLLCETKGTSVCYLLNSSFLFIFCLRNWESLQNIHRWGTKLLRLFIRGSLNHFFLFCNKCCVMTVIIETRIVCCYNSFSFLLRNKEPVRESEIHMHAIWFQFRQENHFRYYFVRCVSFFSNKGEKTGCNCNENIDSPRRVIYLITFLYLTRTDDM